MITLFKAKFEGKIKVNKKEIAGGKFFTKNALKKLIKQKKTTPFFNAFFNGYFK